MKFWIISAALVIVVAALIYGVIAIEYKGKIREADEKIALHNNELIKFYNTPITPPPQIDPEDALPPSTDTSFCLTCHEKKHVASFHNPDTILKIDQERGLPVRICTTCHGSPVMPVHFKAIKRDDAKCEACHLRGENTGFIVPKKRDGDLLICQLCHAGGDYIAIHIDGDILKDAEIDDQWIRSRVGRECVLCHNKELYGGMDILDVHAENALKSGFIATPNGSDSPTLPGIKRPLIEDTVEVFPMKPSFGAGDLDWPNKTAPSNSVVVMN